MLSACFAADLGKASCCSWSERAVSCCALVLPAPKYTEAASTVTPARHCRLGYFRVTLRILVDQRPDATGSPLSQTNAAAHGEILDQPLVTSGAGAATGYLPTGLLPT